MMENIIAAARFERKRLCENWLYLHCFSVKVRTFFDRMILSGHKAPPTPHPSAVMPAASATAPPKHTSPS